MTVATPYELRDGHWYKRDDLNAHPSGVNGGKWRQCQWLIERAAAAGATTIVTGASVLSPQIPMTAIACRQSGLDCIVVVGGTTAAAAAKHPGVRIALDYGATVTPIKVGYNPALQAEVRHLHATIRRSAILHYGVAPPPDADDATLAAFYDLGAREVATMPGTIRTLIVPFGSGHTATSILYGVWKHRPAGLRDVHLIGIGPSKFDAMMTRLARLGTPWSTMPVLIHHHDLHGQGIVRYHDRVRYVSDDIVLHPTYEAKVARWVDQVDAFPGWAARDGSTCLWVVGAAVAP